MQIRNTPDVVRQILCVYTENGEDVHLTWHPCHSGMSGESTPAKLAAANVDGIHLADLFGLSLDMVLQALGTDEKTVNERWRRDYGAEHEFSKLRVRRTEDTFEIRNIA
ncbi:MAG TPA: hypothetical protein VD907_00625 [Verrucomicrobiae bacterium]|nr:hypothetical protein [Verrucomicrobiae bacterium]